LIAPSSPILLPVLSENEISQKEWLLQLRLRCVRDEFDLSASDNLTTPLKPIEIPVLSENEMKQQACYRGA
jgi:hypothetical protein